MSTFFNLPSLRSLHLSGRTMSSLSWESLRDLLEPPVTTSSSSYCLSLDEIHLSGLPPGKASTFDDENAALQRLSGSYFASRGSRDGSVSPSLLAGNAMSSSVPTAASSSAFSMPMAPMIRSASLDGGIGSAGIESSVTTAWPWQCENKDYGKHHEGKGSMVWFRTKQQTALDGA